MKNKLFKTLLILIFALVFCYAADAQVVEPKVEISQSTADKCSRCFSESPAKDDLIAALKSENESRKNLALIQEGIIQQQKELISILQKQTKRKLKILFGLISVTF